MDDWGRVLIRRFGWSPSRRPVASLPTVAAYEILRQSIAGTGGAWVGGAVAWPYAQAYWKSRSKPDFRVAKVTKGDLVLVVNSTGTVQPVLRVQVGAVVSGPIEKLYVDHNAKVRKDQILAKIDARIYTAAVTRDEEAPQGQGRFERVKALLQQAKNDEVAGREASQEKGRLHFRHRDGPAQVRSPCRWRPNSTCLKRSSSRPREIGEFEG